MPDNSDQGSTRFTIIAVLWYALAFILAAAGAYFADSRGFVSNAWHVYFIEKSRGVLTTDADVTRSELYRLVMASIGSLLCVACFLRKFNTKSPRDSIVTAPTIRERRWTVAFAIALLLVTLLYMPANLHSLILTDMRAPSEAASTYDETIAGTMSRPFPGGAVVVKGDPGFGRLALAFATQIKPAQVSSVTLWRDPKEPEKGVLIATGDANIAAAATPRPPDEARASIDLRAHSALSRAAAQQLASQRYRSYFDEIWRPYLLPYSFYSVGLYLLIIYPVLFLMVRSAVTDRDRFRSPDFAKPELPQAESENDFETFQKQSEYRLDAIRDILPRYLVVAMIVYLIATVEFKFTFIRTSSTTGATTFGQLALGMIWPLGLAVCGVLAACYLREFNFAFEGFQRMERLAHGPLYDTVRTRKINFRNDYNPKKMLATAGVASIMLTALLWLLPKLGTTWIVPSICGAFPHPVSDPFIRALHASRWTTVTDCEHY